MLQSYAESHIERQFYAWWMTADVMKLGCVLNKLRKALRRYHRLQTSGCDLDRADHSDGKMIMDRDPLHIEHQLQIELKACYWELAKVRS